MWFVNICICHCGLATSMDAHRGHLFTVTYFHVSDFFSVKLYFRGFCGVGFLVHVLLWYVYSGYKCI